MFLSQRSVSGSVVFGIPDEALFGGIAAIVVLVAALKLLGGRKEAPKRHHIRHREEPEAAGVGEGEHTELEDMMAPQAGVKGVDTPETVDEEETAGMSVETGGLEALLAQPIDAAPSIGAEERTNVEAGLEKVKFEATPGAAPDLPDDVKEGMEEKIKEEAAAEAPLPSRAKDLTLLKQQFGEEYDIDDLGDIVAVPAPRPKYTPPKDIGEKAEKEAAVERPAKLYDRPRKERVENYNRYCMLQFDAGKTPKKAEGLLRVKGLNASSAKQIAFRNYKIWIGKREPLIREIKETRDLIKRIEYKFLKQQLDGVTRKASINEANKRIAGLEAKLKSSEDYFE